MAGATSCARWDTRASPNRAAPPAALDAHAFAAAQRGWLDYRRIGDVAEFGFRYLLRPTEGTEETANHG